MPRITDGRPKLVNIGFRVPPQVQERLQSVADEVGLSPSDILRLMLDGLHRDGLPESLRQAAHAIRVARGRA